MLRQIGAEFITCKVAVRVLRLESFPVWPVTDDHLAARHVQAEQFFDVLLDGNSPHVHPYRPRQVILLARLRDEYVRLDAPGPDHDAFEAPRFEQ